MMDIFFSYNKTRKLILANNVGNVSDFNSYLGQKCRTVNRDFWLGRVGGWGALGF